MGGPDQSYDAAQVILQTCEDMVGEYEHLAESGSGILENITGSIGLYYQYEYTYTGGNIGTTIEYHDRDIRWYEKWVAWSNGWQVSTERVPHPDREIAMERLGETQGEIEDADTKFDFDSKDIRDTVSSLAAFMSTWVDSAKSFSEIIYPEDPRDITTSGSTIGWRSPDAFGTYQRNVQLQYGAKQTTQDTVVEMLAQCAAFLEKMSSHLAQFAQLVRTQEQYYVELATHNWIPDKFSITEIISKIGDVGTKVVEFKTQQDNEAKAMIDVLNSAIGSVLKIEELRMDINGMARSGEAGWPMPQDLSGAKESGQSSITELEFNTQYFKDHIDEWSRLAEAVAPVAETASATPAIQRMFYRWPAFAASTASGLNDLSEHITDKALLKAETAAGRISEILDTTIRNYIAGEDLNAAEAQKLEAMLNE